MRCKDDDDDLCVETRSRASYFERGHRDLERGAGGRVPSSGAWNPRRNWFVGWWIFRAEESELAMVRDNQNTELWAHQWRYVIALVLVLALVVMLGMPARAWAGR